MGERGAMPLPEDSELIANAKILDITHQEPMLVITDENERRQRLVTDTHALGISGSGRTQQRVTIASWDGDALVVGTTMNNGARLAQKYQIEQKTGRLVVVSAISFPEMKPVSYRQVYDRVMSGNEKPKEREGG
jgi:hypothetical protein